MGPWLTNLTQLDLEALHFLVFLAEAGVKAKGPPWISKPWHSLFRVCYLEMPSTLGEDRGTLFEAGRRSVI